MNQDITTFIDIDGMFWIIEEYYSKFSDDTLKKIYEYIGYERLKSWFDAYPQAKHPVSLIHFIRDNPEFDQSIYTSAFYNIYEFLRNYTVECLNVLFGDQHISLYNMISDDVENMPPENILWLAKRSNFKKIYKVLKKSRNKDGLIALLTEYPKLIGLEGYKITLRYDL